MIRVVLDTNIYISAFFWKNGKQHQILRHAVDKKIQVICSRQIMAELSAKLGEKFKVLRADLEEYTQTVERLAYFVEPAEIPNIVKKDPKDDKIIATAIAGGAEYIVTGDNHLLELEKVQDIKIVNSEAFIQKLSQTYT
jgi:putative PIN family toxin of toxin-antitoxin system